MFLPRQTLKLISQTIQYTRSGNFYKTFPATSYEHLWMLIPPLGWMSNDQPWESEWKMVYSTDMTKMKTNQNVSVSMEDYSIWLRAATAMILTCAEHLNN